MNLKTFSTFLALVLLHGWASALRGDSCQSCTETTVKFYVRGVCRIAGQAKAQVILGDIPEVGPPNVIAERTVSGGQIAGNATDGYYAASYECKEWESDVMIGAKLYQNITIHYELVADPFDARYTEFEAGVEFEPGLSGNPIVYLSKPSSPMLNVWYAGEDKVWVEGVVGYVSTGDVSFMPCLCGADATIGDGELSAGSLAPEPRKPEFNDSKPIGSLLGKCPAEMGAAMSVAASSTTTSRTDASTGKTPATRRGRGAAVALRAPAFQPSDDKVVTSDAPGIPPRANAKTSDTSLQSTSATTLSTQTVSATPYSLSDPIGRLRWEMNLGTIYRRLSLGSLVYQADAIDSTAYSPAKLMLSDGGSRGLVRRDTSGNLRQIEAGDRVVDIKVISSGTQVSVYPESQISGTDPVEGTYTFDGNPEVIWKIENPGGTGRIAFTKIAGNVTQVHEASWTGTPGQAGTMTISRFGGKWKEVRTYAMAGGGTQRIETISRYKNNVLEAKTRETYQQFNNWGQPGEIFEALVERVEDPDGQALTTTTTYWDMTALPGNLPFTITHPDGLKEWYATRVGIGGGNWPVYAEGHLLRLVQSYKDSDPTNTTGRMSYTTYTVYSPTLLLEEKTDSVNNNNLTTVGYTVTEHDFSNEGIWVKRVYDYSGNGGQFAYEEEWLNLNTRRPLVKLDRDGRVKTYHYGDGYWNPATQSFEWVPGNGSIIAKQTTITHGVVGQQYGIENQTTIDVEVTDAGGRPLLEESYVNTNAGLVAEALLDRKVHTYVDGRRTRTEHNGRVTFEAEYDWRGLVQWEIDETGRRTEFAYDEMDRVWQRTVRGRGGDPDEVVTYDYDVRGHLVSQVRTAGGLTTSQSWHYNLAGELDSVTGPDGLTSTIVATYTGGSKTVTETLPTQGTRITSFYKDRQVRSTRGTAVEDEFQVPSLVPAAGGGYFEGVSVYRDAALSQFKSRRIRDWLGDEILLQTLRFKGTGTRDRYTYYDTAASGQTHQRVVAVTETGRVAQLFGYDSLGRLSRQGLDFTGNGTLDEASTDRLTTISQSFENAGGGWEEVTTVQRQLTDNEDAPLLAERTRRRAPASLPGSETARETMERPGGGLVVTTVTLDRATGTETVTVDDQELGRTSTRTSRDGRVRAETQPGIAGSRTFTYTALGEVETVNDPLTGTLTYGYEAATRRLSTITDALNRTMTRTYYPAGPGGGLLRGIQDAVGNWTYQDYYPSGLLRRQWGVNTYPTEYGYNEAAAMTSLKTWRTRPGDVNWATETWPNPPGGDLTQWIYDTPTGLLERKIYADTNATVYTYDTGLWLDTKTNARSQVADYTIDGAGQLTAISYSDGTSAVTISYDRAGRQRDITDASGSRTLAWTELDQPGDETYTAGALSGVKIGRAYDGKHRLQNLELTTGGNKVLRQRVEYDGFSRPDYLTDEDPANGAVLHKFDYGFKPGTNLIETVEHLRGSTLVMTQSYTRDGLGRLSGAGAVKADGTPLRQVSYGFDDLDRRFEAVLNDGTKWSYGYNDKSEVTSARRQFTGGITQAVGGLQSEYGYDDIGNRTFWRFGGDASGGNLRESTSGAANALNQLTDRTMPAVVPVTGQAPTALNLRGFADDQPFSLTRQDGERFFGEAPVDNTSWGGYARLKVVGMNGSTVEDIVSGARFVPRSPERFTYDDDGNLLTDGRWSYSWDAENRLIEAETLPEAVSAGATRERISYSYDAGGRRFRKEVQRWDVASASYLSQTILLFVYDGWNLLGELQSSTFASVRLYQWGMDLSGSPQGAGGVGGLLLVKIATSGNSALSSFHYSFDGNGNISQLVESAGGTVVADYEYGAFGELVRSTGSQALANPYRFSTKYQDGETGLVYYGFRYYEPETGRWISRDPLEEGGGVNLYGFVGNEPILNIDTDGLTQWHHRLPQMFADRFAALGFNIHDSRYAIGLPDDLHYQLHDKTGFRGGLDRYTSEWQNFLDVLKKKKGLTKCQRQQAVLDFLRKLESRPEFNELLKKGAKFPIGMTYQHYEKLSSAAKDLLYKEVWSARTAGRELRYLGEEATGVARLARGGKLVPGLHYLVVGALAAATFNEARAAGMSDAGAAAYTAVDAMSPVGAVIPPSTITGITGQYNLVAGKEVMTITVHPDGTFGSKPGPTPGAPIIDTATLTRMMQK